MAGGAEVFFLLLVAFIFPPAAVAFVVGCSGELCLNILLTFLGYLPGLIHALWLVLRFSEANERYGYKNWSYMGMGEYVPMDARHSSGQYFDSSYISAPGPLQPPLQPPPPPPPPPPGQQPVGMAPLPSQAPVDQKSGGYGYTAQASADQKLGGRPAPPSQEYNQGPSQMPAGPVNVTPQAPPDQKTADSTAPPAST